MDSLQRAESNPFGRRRRENREDIVRETGRTNERDNYSHNDVVSTLIPEQQESTNAESNVDLCVAQLVEMGYAEDESESAVEALKVYAQIAEGNVAEAIEMLEEEKKAWS